MKTEEITLIGIILTFIISLSNMIIALRQSNKNTFINTITIARKEYLIALRKTVAEFCTMAITRNEDKTELIGLSYQLKMFMNPASYPNCWDGKAVEMIDKIIQVENNKDDVDKFLALMQSWLALEWRGMTDESKQGTISKKKKQKLRDKYYSDFLGYTKQKNNGQEQYLAI